MVVLEKDERFPMWAARFNGGTRYDMLMLESREVCQCLFTCSGDERGLAQFHLQSTSMNLIFLLRVLRCMIDSKFQG